MKHALEPYPVYRETGAPWLGAVPAHWKFLPNRAIFEEIKDQGHANEPMLSVTISRGVIQQADLLSDTSKKDSSNLDRSKYKLVQPGDIAYNKMRAWQGAVGASKHRGIISPAYVVQRLRAEDDPEYFHHLFRTPGFAKEAERWSYGITSDMWSLRPEHFKTIYTCVPPPAEQAGIVRFLGAVDRKVNRFIRAKRRLIEVLTEQKQAIITHAVTKGLNPHAPLKPSGIDWLGDVPEHWRVLPLKRWVSTKITDGPHETPPLQDDGIDFVSAEGMVNGRIVFERRRGFITRELHETYCQKCRPQRDDIFMCKSGNTTGKVALVDIDREFSVWSPLALVRCKRDWAVPKLLFLVLASKYVQQQVQDRWSYGTQPNLSMAAMERIIVALPDSLDEQRALLSAIQSKTGVIDATIERALREIDLIREYRTRLVADVVTGKVDVRAAAAALPDEPPPPGAAGAAGDDDAPADDDADDDAEAVGGNSEDAAPEEVET